MAEGLAAVGAAASILQLIQCSSKVISRLKDFHSITSDLPECYQEIEKNLTLVTPRVAEIRKAIETHSINEEEGDRLLPTINAYRDQVVELDKIFQKTVPEKDDDQAKRAVKAMRSLSKDTKVKSIVEKLDRYMSAIKFHFDTTLKGLEEHVGKLPAHAI